MSSAEVKEKVTGAPFLTSKELGLKPAAVTSNFITEAGKVSLVIGAVCCGASGDIGIAALLATSPVGVTTTFSINRICSRNYQQYKLQE
jgi:hypothetical protein